MQKFGLSVFHCLVTELKKKQGCQQHIISPLLLLTTLFYAGLLPLGSDLNSADPPSALPFQEQPKPFDFTFLPQEFGVQNRPYCDDKIGNQPLTGEVLGGFYPPGYVYPRVQTIYTLTAIHSRPLDPDSLGDPCGRPLPNALSVSNDVDTAWRLWQTIQRGVKKEVKLTNGNFITEYPVPKPVYSAVEAKWTSGARTTEFS